LDSRTKAILAVISGLLLFLSFPKYGDGAVIWLALVPLLYALRESNLKSGFITGFITGFIFNIGILYWVGLVVLNYGHLPLAVGLLATLCLAAYLGIYVSLFAGGVVYFRNRGLSPLIAAPLLWTSLEYVKSHALTGFPWENLAYSQYKYGQIIQIADVTGIYGLTFAILFINALLYDLLINLTEGSDAGRIKRLIKDGAGLVICFLFLNIYGIISLADIEANLQKAPPFEVSLVQGNIDQSVKWHPDYQQKTLNVYGSLSKLFSPPPAGLIIWPETAVPFYFQDGSEKSREVVKVAKGSENWLLFGSPSYRQENNSLSFYNSAFLLSPAGVITGRYDKVHLVPYGEYVPLRRYFRFVKKLVEGPGDFRKGDGYYPLAMNNRQVGVLICYEGIFPEYSRRYRNMGVDMLVNITNDAWFGRTSAPYQHLSMTVFRAVENRLYVLRAANTGISAIIEPTGKVIAQTDLFVPTALQGRVRFIDRKTHYMAYGDVFVYICMILLLALFFISRRGAHKC